MVIPYYQILLEYLKDKDDRVKEMSVLLEPPISKDSPLEDIETLVLKEETSDLFPKQIKEGLSNAIAINRESYPFYSKELIDRAVGLSREDLEKYLSTFDREDTIRAMLHHLGYDSHGLEIGRNVLTTELIKWELDPGYYVPVTDFFAPEGVVLKKDLELEGHLEFRDYSDPLRHSKTLMSKFLLPLLAIPACALGTLAAGLYGAMNKPLDSFRTDFNRFSNNVSDGFSAAGEAFSDGFDELREKWEKRRLIAEYDGGDMFFVEHLLSDFARPEDDLDDLYSLGMAMESSRVKISLQDSGSTIRLRYLNGFRPTSGEKVFSPLNYSVKDENDEELILRLGEWELNKADTPLVARLTLPESFKEMVEGFDNLLVSGIERRVKEEFIYKKPKKYKDLSRFESAAFSEAGVCQDVNFLLWYALRQNGVPSYLAVGFRGEDGKIEFNAGHTKVIAFDKVIDKWEEFDATPSKADVDRYEDGQKRENSNLEISVEIPDLPSIEIPSLSKRLKESVSSAYRATKEKAIEYIVRAEKWAYRDLLNDFEQTLDAFNGAFEGIEKSVVLTQKEKDKLAENNLGRTCFVQRLRNIPVIEYNKGLRTEEIRRPFNPKELREAVESLKYFANALPEYIQRYHNFIRAENVLHEVLKTNGKLIPYSSDNPEQWREMITELFSMFGHIAEPPHPFDTAEPRRFYYKAFDKKQIVDEKTGLVYRLHKPKHITDLHSDDRGFFIDNSKDALVEQIANVRRIYDGQIPVHERGWYNLSEERIDLRPYRTNYTLSPEILSFDKNWAVKREDYYVLLGDIMKRHIKQRESMFAYMYGALQGMYEEFKSGAPMHKLRANYLYEGFPPSMAKV